MGRYKKADAIEINANTQLPTLKLIRFTARIDVGLNLDNNDIAQGLNNFTLANARIIFGSGAAYYLPNADHITNGGQVTTASYEPYVSNTNVGTIGTSGVSASDDAIIAKWYTQEHKSFHAGNGYPLSIVISGTYTDESGTTHPNQFYPIRLYNPNTPGELLDIIRNHKYRINIKSITGPGYSSLFYAAANNSTNILYEISVHEEGDINHVVYNGQNMLGVSQVYYEMEGTAGVKGEIKVLTDVSTGWKVTLTDENGNTPASNLISISPTQTTNATHTIKSTATFTLGSANTSNPRIYYATFTAGSLSIKVMILQNGEWYIYSDYQQGMMMKGDGDEYGIYLHGMVPNKVWVRAYSPEFEDFVNRQGSQNSELPDKYAVSRFTLEFTGTGSGIPEAGKLTDNLEILANAMVTNQIRQVQFQYTTDLKTDGTTEWTPFDEGPQSKGHYTLYTTGRTVALYNMKDDTGQDIRLDWAEAMGINTSFNDAYFYTTWNSTIPPFRVLPLDGFTYPYLRDRDNYYYTPTTETGCAAYYEEGDERFAKGKWRLPARIEIVEMIPFSDHIGDLPVNSKYWSGLEDIADQAFSNNLVTGTGDITRKIEKYLVRCVLKEE